LIYVIGWVLIDPKVAPKLPIEQTRAAISPAVQKIADHYASKFLLALFQALLSPGKALRKSADNVVVTWGFIAKSFVMSLVPVFMTVATLGAIWWYVVIHSQADNIAAAQAVEMQAAKDAGVALPPGSEATGTAAPSAVAERSGVQEPPGSSGVKEPPVSGGVQEPPGAGGVQEPPGAGGVQEPPGSQGVQEPPGAERSSSASVANGVQLPPGAETSDGKPAEGEAPLQALGDGDTSDAPKTEPVPESFYTGFVIACIFAVGVLAYYYWNFDAEQYEILNMLVRSVMPLGILTFIVLGVILFGITTATESAAVGAAGAFLMAWSAGTLDFEKIKQAVFLTAKTTSMVCWLFVGSALFSAVFAILGGQRLVEEWVMSMNLTPIQFLLLSQAIIFILGWPLEWTEIIVIFVPIFLPLLAHFQIDPMLWGVMVFVNLQAAFLSPPVAMSAFYLKGVSPPHVTINQIFAGMMPYMFIVIACLVLMYIWPELTLWLPNYLYGK
jgi:TRAP-type mannitol/chloroaromatic compound transport system permease large subunit